MSMLEKMKAMTAKHPCHSEGNDGQPAGKHFYVVRFIASLAYITSPPFSGPFTTFLTSKPPGPPGPRDIAKK